MFASVSSRNERVLRQVTLIRQVATSAILIMAAIGYSISGAHADEFTTADELNQIGALIQAGQCDSSCGTAGWDVKRIDLPVGAEAKVQAGSALFSIVGKPPSNCGAGRCTEGFLLETLGSLYAIKGGIGTNVQSISAADIPSQTELATYNGKSSYPSVSLQVPDSDATIPQDVLVRLQSVMEEVDRIPSLDNIAKSTAKTAVEGAIKLAYSKKLGTLVFSKFKVDGADLAQAILKDPGTAIGRGMGEVGAGMAIDAVVSLEAALVTDALFANKPLSDLSPEWQTPLRALVKATIVEAAGVVQGLEDPTTIGSSLIDRAVEIVQIAQASKALASVQDEALAANAISLETAARLLMIDHSDKAIAIARSTIDQAKKNMVGAVGADDAPAVDGMINLTFQAIRYQLQGDIPHAKSIVERIRTEGKLGSNLKLFSPELHPIDWLTAVMNLGQDAPERAAAIFISVTILNDLENLAAAQAEAGATGVAAQPAVTASADKWGQSIVPKTDIGYRPCGDKSSTDQCLRGLGLSDEAIAFSFAVSGDYSGMGVASSFQELGSVDAAVAQITGADVYYVAVLLNGPLGLSVIDGTADLHSAFQDAGSRALLNEYPDASTFNSLNSPIRAHRTLADGTQRFVLEELVTGSCHACDPIGYALTFLEVGPATGGKLVRRPVGLGYAILPGADMEIVDFSAELLQQTPTALQFLLNELGYDAGSMDGAFGEMGRAALIDFQRDHCLLISGQIDKATFDAILSDNGFDPARCASKTASLTASDIPSQDVTTKPLVAAGTVSPSFDCEKATTPDELSICSNADLAELDQLSATGYRYVTEKFGSEYARKIGKNILKDRHACGEDVSCIRRVQLAAITTYVAEGAPIKTGTPAMTKAQPLPAAFSCTEDDVLSEPGGCHICLTKAPADRVTWSGQCVDGNADGAGVIDWYQGSSLIWRLSSSRYEVVSAGHVTDHYEASGAFTLDYLSTDGGIVTGCIPEVSGGSFTLPQVRINIDADYPMQINDAAGTLMMAVETQVAQDCAKAIKAADINFSDVKNAHITVFGASPAYPDLRPTCEYGHNQINQIHGCYSNGNPWARAFTQALYNETQQLASQKRKEEEAKQAAVAAQAAEAQKISADPCRTAAWSGVIENLADNFFCDKSRAMSLTAAGVELRFYVQDVQFNNGSITLKMGRRTSFIEALAAKVNSGEINDFNTSLQVASAAARWFYCSFPPGSDPGLSIGQSGVLHAKLNTFSADNVILACSK